MTKFVFIDNKKYKFESNTFHMIKECKNLTFKDVNGNLFFHTKTLTYDQIDSEGHEYYSSNSNNYIGFDPSNTMYFHTKLNNQIGSAATMTSSLSGYDNSPASNFLPERGSSVGVFVRFIFDDLGIGDGTGANYKSVPATYLHNAIYAPNPIYNIWEGKGLPPNNPGGNATATTVLLKYDNNMFSLLPSDDLPKSNKFHDSSNLQNNALYAHDANACDKRYNQYHIKVGNCNKPGDKSNSCSPLNDFGYKFGVNGAFQCDNINVMIYSDVSSASGNVARGKGIHEWVSNNNVRGKVLTPSWNPFRDYNQLNDVEYISTSDNCTPANNTLGKWSPVDTSFHSFYYQSLKYHAMGGESCYDDKTTTTTLGTYVSQWKKITNNCNKYATYCDMLQAAPDFGSTADYTLSCQDAIDYIIPWTDNLHLLIHLQNTLWEQYGWNPKSRQKGCIQYLGHTSPCLRGKDPYWYGWNEIPIRNSIMAWPMQKDTQKDTQYTLAVYLDMNNFNPPLHISEDGFIKVTDLKQSDQKDPTRTIWNMICYGMDGNCGVVNYINKINTTTTAYKPITYKLVFFIQKEQTVKTGMNIWSKSFITIDPKSVGSAKILQLDKSNISFSWNNDCWTYTSQPK